jgi:small subunit ribosomal protein S8
LWDEGYILGYTLISPAKLKIFLKYKSGKSVIKNIQIISKPSLRVYYSVKKLKKLDIFLILTINKGFITIDECKKLNIGGEPIIKVQ